MLKACHVNLISRTGGFDSAVHVSEEARNAKVAVPWAIISATVLGSILGWGESFKISLAPGLDSVFLLAINVALVFNMGTDLADVVGSEFGQPMATVCTFLHWKSHE